MRGGGDREVCGILTGRDGVVTRVFPCRNVSDTPQARYRMEGRDQYAAMKAADAEGEELVAIYHSHPKSAPYPSDTDRADARWWPDPLYLLLSPWKGDPPEYGAYAIRDGRISTATVEVVET